MINPFKNTNQVYVWRNSVTDNYKIGASYTQEPLDLSNFLFIRTRERLLLENKVHAPGKVFKNSGLKLSSGAFSEQSLNKVNEDINSHMQMLQRVLGMLNSSVNLPVAFASNALYVLERNGQSNSEAYENVLLPLLKKKIEYLHSEGVAQTVWALSNAGIWDSELWEGLKKQIMSKSFDYVVVKNERWTTGLFITHNGGEHFF